MRKQARFEWDETKNKHNQQKHGVSFNLAQYSFADPCRVIAEDLGHSHSEKRFYCFGKVEGEILTVRFTYRAGVIRIIGAGYWRKGKRPMKTKTKKVQYTNENMGEYRVVDDFLPPPEELAFQDESVKVTITLSKSSVDFFKKAAQKHHTGYQKMIRRLLDLYAEHHG